MNEGCINARADCPCSPGEVHYHTRHGIHVADEVTTAFLSLRERIAAAERERDEAQKTLAAILEEGNVLTGGIHERDRRIRDLEREAAQLSARLLAYEDDLRAAKGRGDAAEREAAGFREQARLLAESNVEYHDALAALVRWIGYHPTLHEEAPPVVRDAAALLARWPEVK